MDIERVFRLYGADMLQHARLLLKGGSRAEDAVQDALLRAMRLNPVFASPEHEKGWLLAVTGNICRDYLRRAWWKRETSLPEDFDAPAPGCTTEQLVTQRERDQALLRAVMELPVKYREAVLLVYYHDLSNQAAADALGISGTAFRSRLMRARDLLRTMLGEEILM